MRRMTTSIRKMPAAMSKNQRPDILAAHRFGQRAAERIDRGDQPCRSLLLLGTTSGIFPASPPVGLHAGQCGDQELIGFRSRNSAEYGTVTPVKSSGCGPLGLCPD